MTTETFNQKAEVELCKRAVCAVFGVSTHLMNGRSRKAHIAWPRQLAMALAMEKTRSTLEFIGQCFGRDHGTVIYSRDIVEVAVNVDRKAKRQWEAVVGEYNELLYGSQSLLEVESTG